MKQGSNVPKLRFPKFTGEWEEKIFGELAQRESKTALSSTSNPSIEYEDLESESGLLKKDILSKTAYKKGILFTAQNVLYGKLRPYLHNWFSPDFSGVAVGDWWVLSPNNIDKGFLYSLLQTQTFDDIANQSSGTKMPRADWKLVSNTFFYVPASINEQSKIGSFFANLDSTITIQQRKLEFLKKLKQGLLQKMFPKKGETVPKLRFPGFSGEWKIQKLGNIGKARSGVGFPEKEQGGREGIPFYKVSDMNSECNSTEMISATNYVSEVQISQQKWKPIVELPAIFFAKVGAAVLLNRKRLCNKPFLLDNNTMAYSLDNQIWDKDFSKALFDTINLVSLVQVGALPSYNAKDVESLEVTIPSKEEQRKIGSFFASLDRTITLQQRKLVSLKKLKKGLLQQMFV